MAEEATRPFDHRAAQGDPTSLTDRVLDGVKPLITLAFEISHRGLAEFRKVLIALIDLLRPIFRRLIDGGQTVRTANRFENSPGLSEQATDAGGTWLRFKALLTGGAAAGRYVLSEVVECTRIVLILCYRCGILCYRCGLAAYRVIYSRALEFQRDGKVELSKSEAAVALLVLASFGVTLAWMVSDTAPRTEQLASASPTDGEALPAMNAGRKTDPFRAIVSDIPTRELAALLLERPSLEGRLYWSEQPMPLPMLASMPGSATRPTTTARPMPVPRHEIINFTVAGAPAATDAPPTSEADGAAKKAPAVPVVASTQASETTVTKPLPPSAPASTRETSIVSAIPPEPPAAAGGGFTAIYQVQLVAVRARDRAWEMWESLLGKHQDVLGDLEPDISSRQTRKRRMLYRLRAGPIDSKSEASALCATLSKRKVDCLVIRASG